MPIDSLTLNGGTIRSQATGADAALSHNGAAIAGSPGPRVEEDPFTARFEELPQNHNGSSAFTFELHFSEAPETLSYTTVAGGLLDVTGATVNGARRLTAGSNLGWEVTMTPSQSGDISIRLPARACTATNAVCAAGGRALANAVSATVEGVPLTASFSGVPAEHDGEAFDVGFHLSEEPAASLSFRTVQKRPVRRDGREHREGKPREPGEEPGLDAPHRTGGLWRRDGAGYRNDRVRHAPRGVHTRRAQTGRRAQKPASQALRCCRSRMPKSMRQKARRSISWPP